MWMVWAGSVALAQGADFSDEAEARMGLSFDLDEVQHEIVEPAARKPAARRQAPRPAAGQPMEAPSGRYDPPNGSYYTPPAPDLAPLPLEPNSVLDTVTVYRNMAFVTRTRRESLGAGVTALRFEGLPPSLLTDGLSARVVDGDGRIVGVEARSGIGEVEDSERIAQVRVDAARAVDELGGIRDRIEGLLAQRAYLRAALVPQGATAMPPIRRVRAGVEYSGAAEVRIAERLRKEEDAAQELNEVVVPLLRKLSDPLATGLEVWVDVENASPGPVTVALRYGVSGAGWVPAYNARLDPTTGQVELEIFGIVSQSTTEDWNDAAILLATADPYSRASVSDLVPWTLGKTGGAGVFDTLSAGAGITTGLGPAEAPPDAQVQTRMDARVEGSGTIVLAIDGRRTLRGDGSPQRLPVALQHLESEVTLSTVPKLAPSVQRRATVRVDDAVPLLPGTVSNFVLSDYVGSGQIGSVVPGEGLVLEFGVDERFRVSRQLVDREETRVGRRTTRYDFRFRTTIINHGSVDATIAIADQLPRSEDVDIVVKARELSGGTPPGEDGLVTWRLPVAAQGRGSVDLAFSVTVPDSLSQRAHDLLVLYLRGAP